MNQEDCIKAINEAADDAAYLYNELQKAVSLLEDALHFTNMVPNRKYSTKSFPDSYTMASEIQKFLTEHYDKYGKSF